MALRGLLLNCLVWGGLFVYLRLSLGVWVYCLVGWTRLLGVCVLWVMGGLGFGLIRWVWGLTGLFRLFIFGCCVFVYGVI